MNRRVDSKNKEVGVLRVWPYLLAFLLPLVLVFGAWVGGIATFAGMAFIFVLTPVIDGFSGFNKSDPETEPGFLYDLLPRLWLPTQILLTGGTLWHITTAELATYEIVGLILSLGVISGGGGITVAHELMHRRSAMDRGFAEVLMGLTNYWHFCIEHVYGHHKNVSTPLDPGTARFGENLYWFLPRTLFGSAKSAWNIEKERCHRHEIGILSLNNRRFRYFLGTLALNGLAYGLFGLFGLVAFIAQSVVAILLLESVNYIEHYGLERQLMANGRYERVQPKHSWNSAHRFTSYLLFNLPRHADHHANASRPYSTLRHFEDSPQMPAGYATMILVSLLPPLWFKIMDPMVIEWRQRESLGSIEKAFQGQAVKEVSEEKLAA